MSSLVQGSADGTLAVQQVTKQFDGLQAVDQVSLTLKSGQIMGLIGPNGSGKTTLLNVISGLLRPSAGRIFCGTVEITGYPPHRIARAGIGRTFQTVRLFSALTVLENIEVAAASIGVSRDRAAKRAQQLLEQFQLAKIAGWRAGTLAHGQKRWVEIARALALAPQFVLLDEPAAGLNENESDELLQLLVSIPEKTKCGILVVDHDIRFIMRLCHDIHVLNHGRTIAQGTPEEIRRNTEVIEAYLGPGEEVEQVVGS